MLEISYNIIYIYSYEQEFTFIEYFHSKNNSLVKLLNICFLCLHLRTEKGKERASKDKKGVKTPTAI